MLKVIKKSRIFFALLCVVCLLCGTLGGCKEQEPTGKFYDLEEAYNNGWLLQEDLKNIAYYFHTYTNQEEKNDIAFLAKPKIPGYLDNQTVKKIKMSYLNSVLNLKDGSCDRVDIYYYYGVYGDCITVGITDDYNVYDKVVLPEYEVGEVVFYRFSISDIRIWREKNN